MSPLRIAILVALLALPYACANQNGGEGPSVGRGGTTGSGSGGQGGSSASAGNGAAGTSGQAPGGAGGDGTTGGTGGDPTGEGGTGGDPTGGGTTGAGGADPRCPSAAPVGGPTCRIPDDAGAFCLYGTMMCVCGATGQTTGMWQCFGGGDTGGSGGDSATGTGGGGGGPTGAAGTIGAGGRGGTGVAPPATPCPASLPSAGSCTPEGKLCSYGTAPRPECRDRATCTGGKWIAAAAQCPAPLSTGCPATPPDVGQTAPCTAAMVDGYCRYTAGNGVECRCVGNATTGGVLVCNHPTAPAAPCPATLPNAGTACGTATQSCAYPCAGQLSSVAVTATCGGGTWSWAQSGCVAP